MKALVLGACWEAIGSFMPRRMTACPLFPLLGDVGGDEDFAGGAQLTTAHRRAMAAQGWCPYWGTTLMGSWQEKKSGEGKGAHWRVRKSSNCSHELNLTSYAWVLDGRQNEAQSERLIARKYDAYSGEGNGTPLQYSCWKAAVHRVTEGRIRLSDFTFTFHFHALEKEMATHSSVLAWRVPGTGEPGGLPSLGSHRVGHDWSDLAAAAAALCIQRLLMTISRLPRCLSGKESAWINKQEN